MPKVLVLGGDGMLGYMVTRVLSQSPLLGTEFTCLRQSACAGLSFNVQDGQAGLRGIIERYGPYDYIVNCIGILAFDISRADSLSVRQAILVNSLFPHDLAAIARAYGLHVIHISTDGVFSGCSDVPYYEDAHHDCPDIYGKTKSLGEVHDMREFLNIRCSIIGPNPVGRRGLMEWFMAQPNGSVIEGYVDHLWNGVTTLQFAVLCRSIILQNAFDSLREESSVHHFCPNSPVSKFELLEALREVYRRPVTIKPVKTESPIRRVLTTRYRGLLNLYGGGRHIVQAIRELAQN